MGSEIWRENRPSSAANESKYLLDLVGKIARRRRNFFTFSIHFYVRKHIFLKDFKYFRDKHPQNFPPAAVVFPPIVGGKKPKFPTWVSKYGGGKNSNFPTRVLKYGGKIISKFPFSPHNGGKKEPLL